jgi:hypothetical protein
MSVSLHKLIRTEGFRSIVNQKNSTDANKKVKI